MPAVVQIYNFLFKYETYKRGLIIHLLLFLVYTFVQISVYYLIGSRISDEPTRVYYQLNWGKVMVLCLVFHLVLLISIRWKQTKMLTKEYFTEEGSPYNLAIFRIIFFFNLGGHFLFYCTTNLISWSHLPASNKVGLPFIAWLIDLLPVNPSLYYTISVIAGVLCLFVCIGIFTRASILLLIPFAFYVIGVPMFYGKISHHHILLWVPIIFCFSPVSDVLSLDALIRRKKYSEKRASHFKYALPFKMLWLQLAIIYCFAGIIKLWDCGLDWALSDSMINQMQWEWVEQYDKVPAFRLDLYPVLAKFGGLSVIYFEILYFLLILKPSGRIWAFLGAFSLHKVAGYFMYIDFGNLRMVGLSYINWHKFLSYFKTRIKASQITKKETGEISLWKSIIAGKSGPAFAVGLLLVFINFAFSALKIHSFPFSSYPTYSGIVKNEIKIVRMEAYTEEGNEINIKYLGEKAGFRWETFRPFEQKIAYLFESGDTLQVQTKMEEYWMMWNNNVKGLEDVTRVKMILETSSIVPEERSKILKSEYLGTIYPDISKR